MTQHEQRAEAPQFSTWTEGNASDANHELVEFAAAHARSTEEAAAAIARQFNGPMTALLLYMNELKQHSHQFAQSGNRTYLQQVVENALQQTERVCAMIKQISDLHPAVAGERIAVLDSVPARAREAGRSPEVMFASEKGRKPLTKREREVLTLISEGCSNKQGALRMNISPRTFESHRAEAMRKLGARNTADLVRKALLHFA